MLGEYGWLAERLAGLVSAYAIVFMLTEGRFGRKVTIVAFVSVLALSEAILCALFVLGGAETFARWYPLAANGPVLALQFAVSRQRPLVIVFANLTGMQMNGIIALSARIAANAAFGLDPTLVNLFVRPLVAVPLLVVLYRWFRPLFLEVANTLRRGWGLLCLMPLAFYVQFYLVYVWRVVPDPILQLVVIGLGMVLMIAAYGVVFVFFDEHAKRRESAEGRRMLTTQVNALERQVDAVRSADERLRIVRHDLRHHMANVSALVREGNQADALEALGVVEAELAEATPRRICENETVNALLVLYLERAEEAGVEVRASCSVPRQLPMASLELASVLANALENAIAACELQPDGESRRIEVRCASTSRFALEVANTYAAPIAFDAKGRPMAQEPGHGTGTRSIVAFAEKHGARLFYDHGDDGMFRLQLLMPASPGL